ncbi:uncharacterized protein LDX57_006184 [Aspergillus melleus]|uniref:uncharacterized protein n=1 Tax=Aspergillus melleus TaxID=138277 RepID=UPI001E8D9CD2|nr:uncharacterized protein LDX57_006184 [Aspergillus melleus]KAH8428485.1 hypothetical protein LDX57_006184 [Aspergillus melleus]
MAALQEWRSTFSSDDSFTSNGSTASAIAFHYMVLLLVEDLCYQLQVPWPPSLSPPSPVPLQSPISQNEPLGLSERAQQKHSLAAAIVHLAQGSISPDTGIYGILRFIMPLHVAHDNILPGSPDQQALHYLMNTVMAGQHGFQMARRFWGQYTSFAESLSTPCQTSEDLQS